MKVNGELLSRYEERRSKKIYYSNPDWLSVLSVLENSQFGGVKRKDSKKEKKSSGGGGRNRERISASERVA